MPDLDISVCPDCGETLDDKTCWYCSKTYTENTTIAFWSRDGKIFEINRCDILESIDWEESESYKMACNIMKQHPGINR